MLNKASIDRGMFCASSYKKISDEECKKDAYTTEHIELPPKDVRKKGLNYELLDENGIVREKMPIKKVDASGKEYVYYQRVYVKKNDVVIGKVAKRARKMDEEQVDDRSVAVKSGDEGYVDKIFVYTNPDGYKIVKIVIRNELIPEIGDKFANVTAQKGTTGAILAPEDMPFAEDGTVPDLIMNPHSQPSRMTINQMLSMAMGKICVETGEIGDSTPFTESSKDIADRLCETLVKLGFDRHSSQYLYNGMTGEPMKAKVFIAPMYYQRLKHLVRDKVHSRGICGQTNLLWRQPLNLRAVKGDLKRIYHLVGDVSAKHLVAGTSNLFLTTTCVMKMTQGTRLMAVPKGNNVRMWTIRRIFPTSYMAWNGKFSTTGKVLVFGAPTPKKAYGTV